MEFNAFKDPNTLKRWDYFIAISPYHDVNQICYVLEIDKNNITYKLSKGSGIYYFICLENSGESHKDSPKIIEILHTNVIDKFKEPIKEINEYFRSKYPEYFI